MPPTSTQEDYCDYLCPLIAKSEGEQAHFRRVFPQHAVWLGLEVPDEDFSFVPTKSREVSASKPRKRFYQVLGLLLAIGLSFAIYQGYRYFFPIIPGCMDPNSENYNPQANRDDGSCTYPEETAPIIGCLDTEAVNYDPKATAPCENCCNYLGCMDKQALNYNPKATIPCDDCCEYARPASIWAELAQSDSVSTKLSFDYRSVRLPEIATIDRNTWFQIYQNKDLLTWILLGTILAIVVSILLYQRALMRYVAR